MHKIFTTLLLLVIAVGLKAQAQPTWEIGGTFGAAGYMGDLNTRNMFQVSGGALGAYVKKNYNPYLSVKAGFMHGWVGAADSSSSYAQNRLRNLSFQTTLNELSVVAEFNLFQFRPGIDRHPFTPYVFLGLGAVAYNPKARVNAHSPWVDLRPLMTENKSYSSVALAIPYGVGLKYNFSNKFSLIADAGYRSVKSDYVDDVSGNYAIPGDLKNSRSRYFADRRLPADPTAGTYGSQRGDGRAYDTYMFFSLSVSFTFVSDKCFFSY